MDNFWAMVKIREQLGVLYPSLWHMPFAFPFEFFTKCSPKAFTIQTFLTLYLWFYAGMDKERKLQMFDWCISSIYTPYLDEYQWLVVAM